MINKKTKALERKIKKLSRNRKIDDTMVYVAIQSIFDTFNKAKSPIDEEITFWMMIYSAMYDLNEDQIVELYKECGIIEFELASRRVLSKKEEVKYLYDAYAKFKAANVSNSFISSILESLGDPEKLSEMMELIPDELKELIKTKK